MNLALPLAALAALLLASRRSTAKASVAPPKAPAGGRPGDVQVLDPIPNDAEYQAAKKAAKQAQAKEASAKASSPSTTKASSPSTTKASVPEPTAADYAAMHREGLERAAAPAGYDPNAARALAPKAAGNLSAKGRDRYDRELLKQFQRAAGLTVDGYYGGSSRGALIFFGVPSPPRAFFKPTATKTYQPPV